MRIGFNTQHRSVSGRAASPLALAAAGLALLSTQPLPAQSPAAPPQPSAPQTTAPLSKPSLPCTTIRGRAHLFPGDGQLRIWHIGTHHEFTPDASTWHTVEGWLAAGAPSVPANSFIPAASTVDLYGNFRVCPVEPFKPGAVQVARIVSVTGKRYVVQK